MAIPLVDQHSQATSQDDFRGRVAAALVAQAITKFSAAPLADAILQAKRLALASAVLDDATAYLTQFAWIVVTRPTLNTVDDLTDSFISTTVGNLFDPAAAQLAP